MADHNLVMNGSDGEAVSLRCTKCQANARFLLSEPGVSVDGPEAVVPVELQDKWLGADCPVEE